MLHSKKAKGTKRLKYLLEASIYDNIINRLGLLQKKYGKYNKK